MSNATTTKFLVELAGCQTNAGSTPINRYLENEQLWRPGNGPFALIREEEQNRTCVVLIHGLMSSSQKLRALSDHLHRLGYTVIVPLLPGHGLINPDKDLEDGRLYLRWIAHVNEVVGIVQRQLNPTKLIIGGFSLGGTLAINTVLRAAKHTFAGLLLFSPAIDLYGVNRLARIPGIHWIAKRLDGKFETSPEEPFEYPRLSKAAGVQVAFVVRDNHSRMRPIDIPVLAICILDDETTDPRATMQFVRARCPDGRFVGLSAKKQRHSNWINSDSQLYTTIETRVSLFLEDLHR